MVSSRGLALCFGGVVVVGRKRCWKVPSPRRRAVSLAVAGSGWSRTVRAWSAASRRKAGSQSPRSPPGSCSWIRSGTATACSRCVVAMPQTVMGASSRTLSPSCRSPALGGQVGAGAGCWLRGSQVRGAGAAVSAGAVGAAGVLGAGPGVAVAAGPGGAGEGPLVALVAGVHEVGAVRDADPVQGRGPRRAPGAVLGQTRRTVAGGGMRPPALVAAGEVLLDQAWEVVPAGRGARGGGGRTQGELHRAR